MSTAQTTRTVANTMFLQRLPQRATLGDKAFRKGIILDLVEQTGCTIAAASTHYNHAFQRVKESEPELVKGLGRPEGKNNGGRKKKAIPVQAPASPVDDNLTPDTGEPQTLFKVCKKKDSSVVAEGLTLEAAKEMVAANEGKRFVPKLYWV